MESGRPSVYRRRRRTFLCTVVLFALFKRAPGGLQIQVGHSFGLDGDALIAIGATPDQSVAVFGMAHKTEDPRSGFARDLESAVDDAIDGYVQLILA